MKAMKKWILGSIFTLLLTQSCFAQNTIDDSILIDNLIDLKKIDNKNILASTSTHAINTTEETIGPWTLKCTTKKFPNKFIANRYLNTQQVEIRSCYATQTVYHDSDNQNITAILKITPARILFETRNIIDRHKTPKLIIGEQQRQYTLYANCYNKSSATNTSYLREKLQTKLSFVKWEITKILY